jgi:tRNA uridine 5-carboxymethylaminomethyl modification enzyme
VTLAELLRRPELDWAAVETIAAAGGLGGAAAPAIAQRVEIEIKYSGYLRRQEVEARRVANAEQVGLPADLDYAGIPGLSREVVEKLDRIRPRSIGQASRISGVTPAAVAILLTHIGLTHRRRAAVPSVPS